MGDNPEYTILREYEPQPIGSVVEYEGKQLEVIALYDQGKDAKSSGCKYFIKHPKGVLGLREAEIA